MENNPFEDFIEFVVNKHGEENWITVYKQDPINNSDYDGGMYCALVSQNKTEKAMQQASWDLMIGNGGPGFDGESYYTNLDKGFLRPVLNRDFHGRKENYIEILEEFRLFHNLYFDENNKSYLSFDDEGDEVEVVKLTGNEVKIRRKFLRSFMAARQMNLLLYFEFTRHFTNNTDYKRDESSEHLVYTIYSGNSYSDGYTSFSRIFGKKLILCGSVEDCGVWPFEQEKNYQEFIIGGDSDEPKIFSCNPDLLSNYFGANPEAPHYLTPVFFSKEVMKKYYDSSEYEITDGYFYRAGAWKLRFDNNSREYISVFLGDLGRDLPEREQIYWRSFNLIPDGRKISRTNFERSFMGNFCDSENPEHRFKNKFKKLQEYWNSKYGWYIFLPLSAKDEHFFDSLRSMLTKEQSEFDAQILALTKITIDSINIESIRSHLGVTDKSIKSISLMENLLDCLQSSHKATLTTILKGLQSIRSTGVAHRKGTKYEKTIAKLNIDDDNYSAEFDQLLLGMILLFEEVIQLDSGGQ